MKLKIKDSKYFSELGGWKSLATAIFAVILLGKGEEKGVRYPFVCAHRLTKIIAKNGDSFVSVIVWCNFAKGGQVPLFGK